MLKVKYLASGNDLKAGNRKRKRCFWLAIVFMAVLLLSISYSPVFAEETDDTGWVTENSNTYYTCLLYTSHNPGCNLHPDILFLIV